MGTGVLWAERLGHLALDTEVYLLEREAGLRTTHDEFSYRQPVCNEWLLDKFAQHLLLIGNGYIDFGVTIPWHPGADPYGLIETSLPMLHVGFTLTEQWDGHEALTRLGVDGSHVLVHARDDAYLDAHMPGGYGAGWDYHDYRDADIDTYLPAMHAIVEQGHTAVRFGHTAAKPLGHTGPHLVDYPYTGERSDMLDCWLAATCRWMLVSSSGPASLGALFRRPIAFANCAPFLTVVEPLFPMGRLFLPKLYERDGEVMSVREIIAGGYDKFDETDKYTDQGVRLVDNTPDEIVDLAEEMHMRQTGGWGPDTGVEQDQQAAFWEACGEPDHGKLRIGARFLRAHADELLR